MKEDAIREKEELERRLSQLQEDVRIVQDSLVSILVTGLLLIIVLDIYHVTNSIFPPDTRCRIIFVIYYIFINKCK